MLAWPEYRNTNRWLEPENPSTVLFLSHFFVAYSSTIRRARLRSISSVTFSLTQWAATVMCFCLPSPASRRGSLQYYRDRVTLAETITHTYTVTSVEGLAGIVVILKWKYMCMHCKILFYYFFVVVYFV